LNKKYEENEILKEKMVSKEITGKPLIGYDIVPTESSIGGLWKNSYVFSGGNLDQALKLKQSDDTKFSQKFKEVNVNAMKLSHRPKKGNNSTT